MSVAPTPEGFFAQAADLFGALRGGEQLFVDLSAEHSDFVRFNHGSVRQAGTVAQARVSLHLVDGRRHAYAAVTATGDATLDRQALAGRLDELRQMVAHLPDDPHLLLNEAPLQSHDDIAGQLPEPSAVVRAVTEAAGDDDLVGIWAGGPITRALASSVGHRCWFSTRTFSLDYSIFAAGDKAVKASYAGRVFDEQALRDNIAAAARQLPILSREPRRIDPGEYRAFLSPAANLELMELLAWGGFGERAHQTRQSPLLKLIRGESCFDGALQLSDRPGLGYGPRFTSDGFGLPDEVALIRDGQLAGTLRSSRSAAQYGGDVNARNGESPVSLTMAGGDLADDDVFDRLGTGIYVSNLWYLNHSDPVAGRVTGMTRFATLWVEDGEPVAPLAVMRFDDTLYNMLGTKLEALTAEPVTFLDPGTYGGRSTSCTVVPGALLSGLQLTL